MKLARKNSRLKKQCEGKKKFASAEEAHKLGVAHLWKQGKVRAPYRCRFCHKWHITTTDRGFIKEKMMKEFAI